MCFLYILYKYLQKELKGEERESVRSGKLEINFIPTRLAKTVKRPKLPSLGKPYLYSSGLLKSFSQNAELVILNGQS